MRFQDFCRIYHPIITHALVTEQYTFLIIRCDNKKLYCKVTSNGLYNYIKVLDEKSNY